MKAIKIIGIKRIVYLLEWDDRGVKEYVEKDIKENKEFYLKLAEM